MGNLLGGILTMLSLLAMLAGLVSLVYPLRFARIQTRKQGALVAAAGLVGMIIGGSIVAPPDSGPAAAVANAPARPVPPAPEKTPMVKLKEALASELGRSNREPRNDRLVSVEMEDSKLVIQWRINDNLTSNLIQLSAKRDATTILRILSASDVEYSEARLEGTFAIADEYGNAEEEIVVAPEYSPETVGRINWDGFLSDNVYRIADDVYLHRAMGN